MLCFRDRTFCSSETHHADCNRRWTSELQAAAELWWGKPGAPVAFADFCGPAQGIEAAPAAETVQQGSVHESPVAKPCAQKGSA